MTRRLGLSRGTTLLELLLALSALALVVLLAGTGLRVGVRAWEGGERSAAAQQEVRALVELLTEALASAYPYRGRLGDAPQRVVLFLGEPDSLRFVTTASPLALEGPAPFHAVTLRHTDEATLRLGERLVPADEPFGETPAVILSRRVAALRLTYQDGRGVWQDRWDGPRAGTLPAAVRVELTLRDRRGPQALTPWVVVFPLGPRGQDGA